MWIWNNMNISCSHLNRSNVRKMLKPTGPDLWQVAAPLAPAGRLHTWALHWRASSTNRLTSRPSNNLWAIKNHEKVPRIWDFSMDPVLSLNAWLLMNMTIVTQVQRQNGDTGYLLNVINFINFIWTKLQLLSNPNYPNLWNHCFLNGFLYPLPPRIGNSCRFPQTGAQACLISWRRPRGIFSCCCLYVSYLYLCVHIRCHIYIYVY
jgi:hypothetical protein